MGILGLTIDAVGDALHGHGEVVPTMWSPGTDALRTSVLVAWADTILGLLAVRVVAPRVPVTLDIDVHLFAPITGLDPVRSIGTVTKLGSSAQVFRIDFLGPSDEVLGFGHATFVPSPNPELSIPTGDWALQRFNSRRSALTVPLTEFLDCRRIESGVAQLPNGPHARNASNTLNGGLLAVAVEEAALSALDTPSTLTSMQLRYLRPVRADALATATVRNGLGRVEVRDSVSNALAVVATTRSVASTTTLTTAPLPREEPSS